MFKQTKNPYTKESEGIGGAGDGGKGRRKKDGSGGG